MGDSRAAVEVACPDTQNPAEWGGAGPHPSLHRGGAAVGAGHFPVCSGLGSDMTVVGVVVP